MDKVKYIMETSKDWLKIDFSGEFVPRHVNLLIQKTTADRLIDVTAEDGDFKFGG